MKIKNRGLVGLASLLFLSGCQSPASHTTAESIAHPQAQVPTITTDKTTTQYSGEEWYDMLEVFEINTEANHADFYPYETRDKAIQAEASALDNLDYTDSAYVQSLNGMWDFYYADDLSKRLLGETMVPFNERRENWNTEDWDTVSVPGNLETYRDENGDFAYEKPHYVNQLYSWMEDETIHYGWDGNPVAATARNGVMHYKRDFVLDETMKDRNVFVQFQGVGGAFYVYVNGHCVGYAEDSMMTHEFNITPYLNKAMEVQDEDLKNRNRRTKKNADVEEKPIVNTIAVEVVRFSDGSYLENQDAITLSGIFRDVVLVSHDEVAIRDVATSSEILDDGSVDLTVNMDVLNLSSDIQRAYKARVNIMDEDGNWVFENDQEIKIPSLESNPDLTEKIGMPVEVKLHVDNAKLWSPDAPHLYRVVLSLLNGRNKATETVCIRVGFREISTEQGKILLNGQPIYLHGVNRVETNEERGRALTKQDIIEDLTLMKANNINAFRTAHYPNHILTYDIADELGLMVVDEANVESHVGEVEIGIPGNKPAYNAMIMERIQAMVERDKNHAGVIIWSLGNESTYQEYPMDENYPFYNASMWILQKDPSRLRMYERDNRIGKTREQSMVDIVSTQYYSIEQMEQCAVDYAGYPVIQQEYAHAMGNGLGNLEEYWQAMDRHRNLNGGFIWDWIDQSIMTNLDGHRVAGHGGDWGQVMNDGAFCGNGLLNSDRSSTGELAEVKKVYQDVDFSYAHGQLTIANRFPTINLNEFDLLVKWFDSQGNITETTQTIDLEAGKQTTISLRAPSLKGEAYLEVSLVRKKDTAWVNKNSGYRGEEVAFEQFKVQNGTKNWTMDKSGKLTLDKQDGHAIIRGEHNGETFEYDFNLDRGQLESAKLDGKTLMTSGPMLNFYRAPVSNDPQFSEDLYRATTSFEPTDKKVNCKQDGCTLRFSGKLTSIDAQISMTYRIDTAGVLEVQTRLKLPKEEKIGEVARVGLQLRVDEDLDEVVYYGRGLFDNYEDRKSGSKLGWYRHQVDEDTNTKTLKPQDSGNHTDVKWVQLQGKQGGVQIEMKQDMNMQVTRYDAWDVAQADHFYKVQPQDDIIVNVDYQSRGLGNASWGDVPLEQYQIRQGISMEFDTRIELLSRQDLTK